MEVSLSMSSRRLDFLWIFNHLIPFLYIEVTHPKEHDWNYVHVKNQAFKNENEFLDSPNAPLEQAFLHTNLVANAGEGWESNWAAKSHVA